MVYYDPPKSAIPFIGDDWRVDITIKYVVYIYIVQNVIDSAEVPNIDIIDAFVDNTENQAMRLFGLTNSDVMGKYYVVNADTAEIIDSYTYKGWDELDQEDKNK